MDLRVADRVELRRLEESLWRPETRFDRAYMERILAPDFFEFGRSGRTYDRESTLGAQPIEIGARLPLPHLRMMGIGVDAALVTYVSEVGDDEVLRANRASLWSRSQGGWQLRFHQGTPTTEA